MQDAERILDGKGVAYGRESTYYVRLHVGPNKYKHRSLKTGNKAVAIRAAEKLCYEIEFKQQNGIPVDAKPFGDVINEYVAFRRKQHEQGHTSDHSMRQIERVSQFWLAYAGNRLVTRIGNKELADYVTWRRDYFTTHPFKHHNAKKHPQDKTIQWDIMLGKAILKWAHERGYRGLIPLPRSNSSIRNSHSAIAPPAFRQGANMTMAARCWQKALQTKISTHDLRLATHSCGSCWVMVADRRAERSRDKMRGSRAAILCVMGALSTAALVQTVAAADIDPGTDSAFRILLETQSSYVFLTGNALNRGGNDELEDDSFSTTAGTARANLDLGNGLNLQGDVFGEYAWVNSGSDTTYKSALGAGLHGYFRGEAGAIGVFGALADINFDEDDPGNAPGGPAHVFGLEGLWFGDQITLGAQVGLMDSDRSKDEDMIRDAFFVRAIARHYFAESTLIQAEAAFAKGEMDDNVGEEVEIFSFGARIQHELDFIPGDFNWPGKVYVAYRGDFAEQSDPIDPNDNKSLNSHTILVGTTFTFGHSLIDNERNGAAFDLPSFVRWNAMAGGPIE